MHQTYPQQQQGYMPQQTSPPVPGAGSTMPSQQSYGQQPPQQFQPYQQQQLSVGQIQSGQAQQFQPPHQQGNTQSPHPDRESYQTALPPTVTPGWNDPPPMLPSSGATPNRLSNMRRRPVDPSISGTVGYGASPQSANAYGSVSAYGAPQQDSQPHQQQQQYQAYQQQQQQSQYDQQQHPQHYSQQYGQQYQGVGASPQQQQYGM